MSNCINFSITYLLCCRPNICSLIYESLILFTMLEKRAEFILKGSVRAAVCWAGPRRPPFVDIVQNVNKSMAKNLGPRIRTWEKVPLINCTHALFMNINVSWGITNFRLFLQIVPNDFLSKMLGVKVRKPHSLLFVMERKSPGHKMVFVTDL